MSQILLHAALRSCLLLGLGCLVWPLLSAHRPRWRRRVVLGFFWVLLAVPFLPAVFQPVRMEISSPSDHGATPVLWLGIWVAGSALALVRLGWQMDNLRRTERCARDLGQLEIGNCRMRVRESAEVQSPCVTGWLRTTLLLPPGSESWQEARWQCVLWHERQHALQHDVAALWLVRLTTALYWWNPLVHLAARQFHIECEAVCDAAVLNRGTPPRYYVETLLSFSGSSALAPSIRGKSALRKRIKRFLGSSERCRGGQLRLALGVAAAVGVIVTGSLCGLRPTQSATLSLSTEAALRLSANPFPSSDVGENSSPVHGK